MTPPEKFQLSVDDGDIEIRGDQTQVRLDAYDWNESAHAVILLSPTQARNCAQALSAFANLLEPSPE